MEGRSPTTFVAAPITVRLPNDPPSSRRWATRSSTPSVGVAAADLGHAGGRRVPPEISRARFLRGVFIMPMMATPVAIALVWTMMFHPQLAS